MSSDILFLVDIYKNKTKRFIKRLVLRRGSINVKTELDIDAYLIRNGLIKDNEYYIIHKK